MSYASLLADATYYWNWQNRYNPLKKNQKKKKKKKKKRPRILRWRRGINLGTNV